MPTLNVYGKTIVVGDREARKIAEYIHQHRVPLTRNQLTMADATKNCLIELGLWPEEDQEGK